MNRRTSKLLDHVVNAIIDAGDKPQLPRNASKTTVFNRARNLKRKLAREWNRKPRPMRNDQRMGLIRTLVAMEQSRHA